MTTRSTFSVHSDGIVSSCKGVISQIGRYVYRCLCTKTRPTQNLSRSDMKLLQDEADEQRQITHSEISKNRGKIVRRRNHRHASISFKLATRKTSHMYGCSACGTLLFRPLELRSERKFHIELSDSFHVLSTRECSNVKFGPMRYKSDVSESWKYDVQTVLCGKCNVYLGLHVSRISNLTSFMEISSHGWCERMGAPILRAREREDQKLTRRGSVISPDEDLSIPVGGIEIHEILLGRRYVRGFTTKGEMVDRVPLACKGCQNVLSYADQVLCTRRRWGFGDGPNEPACYMNSLREGSFNCSNIHERELAQGSFEMGDVFCSSCGEQVGYKFHQDKSPSKVNENQEGRYGLVISRLSLETKSDVDNVD